MLKDSKTEVQIKYVLSHHIHIFLSCQMSNSEETHEEGAQGRI